MLSNTLYLKYVQERAEAEIIENEHGFIVYRVFNSECFIMEMYIAPESRGSGLCRSLINQLTSIVSDRGCSIITANIHLEDKGASKTLMSALKLEFRVAAANGGILLIAKEIVRG